MIRLSSLPASALKTAVALGVLLCASQANAQSAKATAKANFYPASEGYAQSQPTYNPPSASGVLLDVYVPTAVINHYGSGSRTNYSGTAFINYTYVGSGPVPTSMDYTVHLYAYGDADGEVDGELFTSGAGVSSAGNAIGGTTWTPLGPPLPSFYRDSGTISLTVVNGNGVTGITVSADVSANGGGER